MNYAGEFLNWVKRISFVSSLAAKVQGIKWTTEWAIATKFYNVIVEGDALTVFQVVNHPKKSTC